MTNEEFKHFSNINDKEICEIYKHIKNIRENLISLMKEIGTIEIPDEDFWIPLCDPHHDENIMMIQYCEGDVAYQTKDDLVYFLKDITPEMLLYVAEQTLNYVWEYLDEI